MNGDSKLQPSERELLAPEQEFLTVGDHQEFDEALVSDLNKAVSAYKDIIALSIKLTNPHDWSALGNKPYMQCSGAEKIASPFKVSMGAPTRERLEREDSKGKFYIWVYQAAFSSSLLRRTIVAQGKCSSRDAFFGSETTWEGEGEERRKVTVYKPTEDVDEENILQAAYTNCFVNGVTRLLGIRNLTWDQLALGGIKQEQVGKVEYRKGGQGGGQSQAASSGDLCSPKQVGLLIARCTSAKVDMKDLLAHLETLGFPRDINKVPWRKLDEVLAWIAQKQTETLNA